MADHHDSHSDEHHGVGHVVPAKYLIATGTALLVLTGVTVGAAKVDFNAVDMPEMNIIVALAIAVLKATLVCLFFMHLRWDRPFNAFVLVGSIAFVGIFISFAMTDTFEYRADIEQYRETADGAGNAKKVEDELASTRAKLAAGDAPGAGDDDAAEEHGDQEPDH